MNSYVTASLLDEARNGRRAVAITGTMAAAQASFREAAQMAPDAERVYRANGRERVTFAGGGELRFLSARCGGHRGLSADTVFIDWDAFESADQYRTLYSEVAPIVAASATGKVVRA